MRLKISTRFAAVAAATLVTAAALGSLAGYAARTHTVANDTPAPSGTITVRPPYLPTVTPLARPTTTADNPDSRRVARALKACYSIDAEFYVPCVTLALRLPATRTNSDGSTVSDPAGPDLAAECRGDSSLSADELMACLTQPAL